MITSVSGTPTPTLEKFVDLISTVPHGTPLTVRFHDIAHREHVQVGTMRMDRRWFPLVDSSREGHSGNWTSSHLPQLPVLTPDGQSRPLLLLITAFTAYFTHHLLLHVLTVYCTCSPLTIRTHRLLYVLAALDAG